MMGTMIAVALALGCFGLLALVLKVPRRGWEAVGAALALGLLGYALQGSPGRPGEPKAPVEKIGGAEAEAAVAERQALNSGQPGLDRMVVTADAFARHGQFADAANYLRVAVDKDPSNGEAWLAMANALVQHAEGNLSPAALYAFGRANQAAPNNPGPPFFLGLALAQSGRLEEGRAIWAELLARTPADAPWRSDLAAKLADLDAFIARQQASVPQR